MKHLFNRIQKISSRLSIKLFFFLWTLTDGKRKFYFEAINAMESITRGAILLIVIPSRSRAHVTPDAFVIDKLRQSKMLFFCLYTCGRVQIRETFKIIDKITNITITARLFRLARIFLS